MDQPTRNGIPPLAVPCQPAAWSATSQPVLEYINPVLLLPPLIDLRDRTAPDYLDYFHNQLVPDIRKRGIQVPLIGYREGDRVRVGDGLTRLQVSLLDRLETVPVLVWSYKPDDKEMALSLLLANAMRKDLSAAEETAAYLDLMQRFGWNQASLCRNVPGLNRSKVCKALKWLREIPEEYHSKIASRMEGMIPPKGAYLVTLFPPEERKELLDKFIAGRMTVDFLEDIHKRRKDGGKHRKHKPLKLQRDGVTMQVKDPTIERVQAFAEWLLAALKKLGKDGDGIEILPVRLKGI